MVRRLTRSSHSAVRPLGAHAHACMPRSRHMRHPSQHAGLAARMCGRAASRPVPHVSSRPGARAGACPGITPDDLTRPDLTRPAGAPPCLTPTPIASGKANLSAGWVGSRAGAAAPHALHEPLQLNGKRACACMQDALSVCRMHACMWSTGRQADATLQYTAVGGWPCSHAAMAKALRPIVKPHTRPPCNAWMMTINHIARVVHAGAPL